ncbi:MAG: transposase [Chloroflexi bacterium]|nr:transposase [Chloroflexota bacterium]
MSADGMDVTTGDRDQDGGRRSMRLLGLDYANAGGYFVTICTMNRMCVLGQVADGVMDLSPYGQVVLDKWRRIPSHCCTVEVDAFGIMPNHVHGIISLSHGVEGRPRQSRSLPRSHSLGQVVAYFKYETTKVINRARGSPGRRVWQRNYHDHVIRSEADLAEIREYIVNNPMQWELDRDNPANLEPGRRIQSPRSG